MTTINFTKPDITTTYVGRNGTGKCIGIDITNRIKAKGDLVGVTISPINSKGNVANCNIDIPFEDIEAFAAALLKIAGVVSFKLGAPEPAFPETTTLKAGKSLVKCYYSLNMSGRSAFVASMIDIDPDMEDPDELVSDAVKQGVIDRDDAMEIVCVARIDEGEYNHAMGIKTTTLIVGAEVDVTAKAGDMWSGVIYRAEITKIVGDTITIAYNNEDDGDVCWEVDADQCKISE